MSVKVNGTTISMTRGDTLKLTITIFDADGTEYVPIEGDSIRFAMKASYKDPDVLIKKDIPLDTMLLHLEPEDTKNLNMPKQYVYDIELTHANGDVDTFIAGGKLSIVEEVD